MLLTKVEEGLRSEMRREIEIEEILNVLFMNDSSKLNRGRMHQRSPPFVIKSPRWLPLYTSDFRLFLAHDQNSRSIFRSQ